MLYDLNISYMACFISRLSFLNLNFFQSGEKRKKLLGWFLLLQQQSNTIKILLLITRENHGGVEVYY